MIRSLLAAILFVTIATPQTGKAPPHHVVFQMSEPEAEWAPLMAHVMNLRAAFQTEGVEVEVVFFGPGINMLRKTDNKFEQNLKRLADQGVVFAACKNSMRDRQITANDLLPFIIQVDSGIAELTRKQEAHWSYIK